MQKYNKCLLQGSHQMECPVLSRCPQNLRPAFLPPSSTPSSNTNGIFFPINCHCPYCHSRDCHHCKGEGAFLPLPSTPSSNTDENGNLETARDKDEENGNNTNGNHLETGCEKDEENGSKEMDENTTAGATSQQEKVSPCS